jgi:superfamily II DNA helicase RecQ
MPKFRRESERIAKLLGEIARPYNSKMSEKKKKIFQDAWMNGEIKVICATSGFFE